mmetsp:Transcript_10485/g.7823  ORF Transcript_10485/g.7823 Transcript_10485/m.7823 type:complete len:145 (-) Transcript_10485:441-875(-)|eukprot:CAMPEP_0202977140 /NCGR_PEP_ID=MMETSP1396-20130829/83633_1 /ASSEMBLY_ACC=CAM_ASM_000872 /TAXON_ID= /ORGANISM="Pseudokeronopsis sp., Strain Brazil" /LENGTH=144 /DNA_ID=CAMNT_0049715727 /DNA_START=67 /DNA_END=501 /DNA_ORIENTATION=+
MAKKYKFKVSANIEEILSMPIAKLRSELIKGTFTVEELVSLYCERTYNIGRQLNFTTDELFDQALEIARAKDKELEEAKKNGVAEELPELFGIPFSAKDLFEYKGSRATAGMCFLSDNISSETNPYLQFFLDAGAILIAKGNVP